MGKFSWKNHVFYHKFPWKILAASAASDQHFSQISNESYMIDDFFLQNLLRTIRLCMLKIPFPSPDMNQRRCLIPRRKNSFAQVHHESHLWKWLFFRNFRKRRICIPEKKILEVIYECMFDEEQIGYIYRFWTTWSTSRSNNFLHD